MATLEPVGKSAGRFELIELLDHELALACSLQVGWQVSFLYPFLDPERLLGSNLQWFGLEGALVIFDL